MPISEETFQSGDTYADDHERVPRDVVRPFAIQEVVRELTAIVERAA